MKKNIIQTFLIIIYSLIFFIFNAPTALRFFAVPELGSIGSCIMNISGYITLFLICHGIEMISVKRTLSAFGITLLLKIIPDILVDFIVNDAVLSEWAYDLMFLVQTAVIVIVVMIFNKVNFSLKKKLLWLILIVLGSAVIIVSGFVVADIIKYIDYKYEIHEQSDYAEHFLITVESIKELYFIVSFAARILILKGAAGLCRNDGKDISALKFALPISLTAYLILNMCFNTINMVTGIYPTFISEPRIEAEMSRVKIGLNIFRGREGFERISFYGQFNFVFLGDDFVCTYTTRTLSPCGWSTGYCSNNRDSISCATEKIAFLKNEKWKQVKLKNLYKTQEDKLLTEAVRTICDSGSAEILEHCAPYLKKYDPDYLYDLVENFDERQTEASKNEILSEQYISDVINNILNDR